MNGRYRTVSAAGAAAAVLWLLAGMTAVILWMAGNGGLMAREMLACAPPEATGLPEEEYEGVCRMTAAFLTDGGAERFQYEIPGPDGTSIPCFNDREAAHMADCRGLIRLDRTVMWITLAGAVVLTGLYGFYRKDRGSRRAFRRGIRRGLLGTGILAAGLIIWALVNFDGLFITFHRVAFSNDGWLLDPRTDLLIRLMPTEFFIRLGVKGLLLFLIVPALLVIAAAWRMGKDTE